MPVAEEGVSIRMAYRAQEDLEEVGPLALTMEVSEPLAKMALRTQVVEAEAEDTRTPAATAAPALSSSEYIRVSQAGTP
jgi:hypothetical protein